MMDLVKQNETKEESQKMKRHPNTVAGLTAIVMLSMIQTSHALRSKFADIVMTQCAPGGVYNIRQIRGLPYSLINETNNKKTVEIYPEIPGKDELKENYEAIPDPTWVKVIPDKVTLGPGETVLCDVILSIPNDEKLKSRHFQAHIVAREATDELGQGVGLAFGILLRSRIRFSTGDGPASILAMKQKGLLTSLNFSFEPSSLFIPGFVDLGRPIDLSKENEVYLSLINRGHNNLKMNLISIDPQGRAVPPEGYEMTPDPSWLSTAEENPREIKTKSVNDVNLKLNIPDDPKYRGKRYMFLLKCEIVGLDIPLETYSRIYISTKQKSEEEPKTQENKGGVQK